MFVELKKNLMIVTLMIVMLMIVVTRKIKDIQQQNDVLIQVVLVSLIHQQHIKFVIVLKKLKKHAMIRVTIHVVEMLTRHVGINNQKKKPNFGFFFLFLGNKKTTNW